MCKQVIDVLLVNADVLGREKGKEERDDVWHLMKNRIALADDGHISVGWDETLPLQEDILDCCLPAVRWQGKPGLHPTRQFSTHYALLNDAPAKPEEWNWDPDQRLREFVVLSRIVHPSAIGFEYCARLIKKSSSEWDIIPADGLPAAYPTNPRTFLLSNEWQTTANLVERWRESGAFHNESNHRIYNALWWREKTAEECYLQARWLFLIIAIEALIKLWNGPNRLGSTKNFVYGMQLLSSELGVEYSVEDARLAYSIRSSFSHGQDWPLHSINSYRTKNGKHELVEDRECPMETTPLYDRTETVLDWALKKAIEDDEFQHLFVDDALLSEHLDSIGSDTGAHNSEGGA